jgi:hypothetical protein
MGEHVAAGHHHPRVLIARSSCCSRWQSGIDAIVAAIRAVVADAVEDRGVYLRKESMPSTRSPE